MERKIWKIGILFFFLFFLLVFYGCRENKKEEVLKEDKNIVKNKIEINVESDEIDKILSLYKPFIGRYIIEEKRKEVEDYIINWKIYSVYFNSSVYNTQIKKEIIKNYDIKRTFSSKYEKYIISSNIELPNGDSINLDNIFLYFPIYVSHKSSQPRIAFVVDDLVEDNYWVEDLLSFPYTLNVSIIPTSHTKDLAYKFVEKGWEIMMHLPMESITYPKDAKYLTSEAIMSGMSEEEIDKIVSLHLKRFGDTKIYWVNNHMGSKVTGDDESMEKVLRVFKKYGLSFLDSKTIINSVGKKVGNKVGVPVLENMLFIDHENQEDRIKQRFAQAIKIAEKRGWGIFIFHLRPKTIKVLKELYQEGFFNNVKLERISDLAQEVYNLREDELSNHSYKTRY